MDFVLKRCSGLCLLEIKGGNFDENLFQRLINFIEKNIKSKKHLGINCKNIENFEFAPAVEYFCKNNVSLFNLNTFATAQASLLNAKRFPYIYLDEDDFKTKKRMLARRRFKVV